MLKRTFDLAVSSLALMLLLPVIGVIAAVVWCSSDGPVLFRQTRVGVGGQSFVILKFRSMAVAREYDCNLTASDDSRITRVGRILRAYKLDELPQLWNIVRGEMSLVGPRPELPEYVRYYPEELRDKILSVRPGLTDFAAIQFRNEEELLRGATDKRKKYIEDILPIKIGYYERYVDERTFLLDLLLIAQTIVAIVRN